MVNSREEQYANDREMEDLDQINFDDSASVSASGLTERLAEIFVEDGDGDLLLQQSDREDSFMQWLQALDMQVIGACRADERLKPLLKLNVSSGSADDRLLAHLSQHFEPAEVGMLARCLCVPLVSIRVGRINKQGTLLCPTTTRGSLNLTLLPTSELRISFVGDDGHTERLAKLSKESQCAAVGIEEILSDKSGRSFSIKIADSQVSYFWCSERSKLLGDELLRKMKDLLGRKPSLAELTGISESRLDCFAIHLRAYLVGSALTNAQASPTLPVQDASPAPSEDTSHAQSSSLTSLNAIRSRYYGCQGAKVSPLFQSSLSPKPSSFKEGLSRSSSFLRSIARERLRPSVDNSLLSADSGLNVGQPGTSCTSNSSLMENGNYPEAPGSCPFPAPSFLELLGRSAEPPLLGPTATVPSPDSPLFSPYYCWCPPAVSTLQYTVGPPQLPVSSTESFSLPPLSSLLSTAGSSSLLTSKPTFDLPEVPSVDFPPILPEQLVRLPLSITGSQPIPTFTPLMCDPIVHIPVIDICSSGQGYLVSAGPAVSTTIAPLHSNLLRPLIPEPDPVVEKGARETLRLLISSSNQPNPHFMDVLPSVLTRNDERQTLFATGSRGMYCGTKDIDSIAGSVAAIGFVSPSDRPVNGMVKRAQCSSEDMTNHVEKPAASGDSAPDRDFQIE